MKLSCDNKTESSERAKIGFLVLKDSFRVRGELTVFILLG